MAVMSDYEKAYQQAQKFNSSRTWIERSALGDLIGASKSGDQKQALLNTYMENAYNSAEAQKNRDFQEYMSNTAFQRSANDLKAVGFSPMALLSSSSSAASTPTGYSANSDHAPTIQSGGSSIISDLIKVIGILAGKPTNMISIWDKRNQMANKYWSRGKEPSWEDIFSQIEGAGK